jgi:hypothetical protein
MYNSLPPALAAAWFSISERDIATAIGSLFNPLGNAAGQVLNPHHLTHLFLSFEPSPHSSCRSFPQSLSLKLTMEQFKDSFLS